MHQETTTKEKILKKVRKALIQKSSSTANIDFDSDIYQKAEEPLEIIFAQQFTKLNGKFIYCENEKELSENLSMLMEENKWDNHEKNGEGIFCFENKAKEILKKSGIDFSENEKDVRHVNVGVSLCEFLAARTGSVLVSSKQTSGRILPAFANYHIVIAYSSQLVYTIKEALGGIKNKYKNDFPSMIVNISGPSRTADIEKTLVQGAHGPKEIYVFLVDG
ncbi:MAG: LUD domain-containing protein [Bacteroidetes bacterium]|nr:LUD domain-containing protein [Bacteroidota bacterium]